jgi:hypothetical protein
VVKGDRSARAHDRAFLDIGGDEDGRNAKAETVKAKALVTHYRWIIRGRRVARGDHMVVESSMLVEGDDQECTVPSPDIEKRLGDEPTGVLRRKAR